MVLDIKPISYIHAISIKWYCFTSYCLKDDDWN